MMRLLAGGGHRPHPRGINVFIYSAVLTARVGQQQPAMAQIVEAREIIEGATGRPTSAWAAVTGQPVGSFAISIRADSVADVIDGQSKLGASAEYAGLAESSGEIWAAPATTAFQRVIGSSGDTQDGAVISMTTTTIESSFSDAIAFGHEVMEYVAGATGASGLLMLSEAPNIGELTWVFANPSAEAAAEADTKLQGDADYLALYDRAGDLFVPGGARRSMAVRLG
jgi:hypothetical protein